MKHQIAFHGKSPFHRSYIEKQLQLHGEKVSVGSGPYFIYLDGRWIHSDSDLDREVLPLGQVVPFLEQYGNGRPIPDSEWMVINEEIDAEEDRKYAAIYNRYYSKC